MRLPAVLALATLLLLSGCFGDDPEPVAEAPQAEVGEYMLANVGLSGNGDFQTAYDPGTGALPGTVPAPIPAGTYAFEGSMTGLQDLPEGLHYIGWLLNEDPVTAAVHALQMAPFVGDSLGLGLSWSTDGNKQDHATVMVTIAPNGTDTPGIAVASGALEGLETGNSLQVTDPFVEAHGHAYVGEDGILHFQGSKLLNGTGIAYGAWALDVNGTWHRLGIESGEAFHVMSATAMPPIAEIRMTLEVADSQPEKPSPFSIAKAVLVEDAGHAGH